MRRGSYLVRLRSEACVQSGMLDIVLHPHSTSSEPAVRSLCLAVHREQPGRLRLEYRLAGDLAAMKLPSFSHVRRGDRLWEHSCFELFVRKPGVSAYCELNLATSGAWAAYTFDRYREGMRDIESFAPEVAVERDSTLLRLRASIELPRLAAAFANGALELAPSAVIENSGSERSFWAAHHALEKPDFHHPNAFVVALQD